MLNQAEMILFALLNKLRERRSSCPYCGGEKVHNSDSCILYGLWFDHEKESIRTHLDD
jgi:hypothetical protein